MEALHEEQTIVEQAKSDPEAFGRLYDAYYQPIFGYLAKRVGNAETAQDLTSETFFQALKNIGRYRDQGKPFKAWLYAIAIAQVGNFFRGRKKILPVLTDEFPEVAADELMRPDYQAIEDEDIQATREQLKRLEGYMKQLSEKWQTILTLRYWDNLTVPEIADTLNMKEGTVKSHIHRALKRLQSLMNEQEQTENASAYADQSSTGRHRATAQQTLSA